jgi:protocatechuate 3,4-dioxygenase beta subunit
MCDADEAPRDPAVAADDSRAGDTVQSAHRAGHKPANTAFALASISGTVTDDAGPLPGARVCAALDTLDTFADAPVVVSCAVSDVGGGYAVSGLPAARYRLAVGAPDHIPSELPPIALGSNETRVGVDVLLRAGGRPLIGTVSDMDGGPIAHATVVSIALASWKPAAVAVTDDAGRYALSAAPGTAYLVASADSYSHSAISANAPGNYNFMLTAAATISGTVIDGRTRAPVTGARVAAGDSTGHVGSYDAAEPTDAQGHFQINGLPPGRYAISATAEHRFGMSDQSVRLDVGQRTDGATIVLLPAVSLIGSFVIAGSPARPCPDPRLMLYADRDAAFTGHAVPPNAIRIDAVLPGNYGVIAACGGYVQRGGPSELSIEDNDLANVVWTFAPGARLRGHVRAPDGTPAAGVQLETHHNKWGQATSGRDGAYEITGLNAGGVTITGSSPAGAVPGDTRTTLTDGGTTELDVVLVASGNVAGTVTDQDGHPVPRVDLFSFAEGHSSRGQTDDRGRYTLDGLPPGFVTIELMRAGSDPQQSVQIIAGQTATADFHVTEQTGALSGTVVDGNGHAVAGATITAWEANGRGYAGRSTSDATGTFSLAAVSSAPYQLDVSRSGVGEAHAYGVARGDAVRLELHRTGSIVGIVRLGDSGPADVVIEGDDREERLYRTDGRFQFDDVAAGPYHLVAYDDQGDRGEATITVTSGARTTADVVLALPARVVGRVVDALTHQPIPHTSVTIRNNNAQQSIGPVMSADDGSFAFDRVARGAYSVTAYVDDSAGKIQVTVDQGGMLNVGDVPVSK